MRVVQTITFTEEELAAYEHLVGSITGLLPVIAYKKLEVPWQYVAPAFLRKVETAHIEPFLPDVVYRASVELFDVKARGSQTFFKEKLVIEDRESICFSGEFHLVSGGLQ